MAEEASRQALSRAWYLLHRGIGADQLIAGRCRCPYRRVNRRIASKPSGPDCHRSHVGGLCHEPFRVLGTQVTLLADSDGLQILHGIFWVFFYGSYLGRGSGSMHWPLHPGASDLGSYIG